MNQVWEMQKLRCAWDICVVRSAESYRDVQKRKLNIYIFGDHRWISGSWNKGKHNVDWEESKEWEKRWQTNLEEHSIDSLGREGWWGFGCDGKGTAPDEEKLEKNAVLEVKQIYFEKEKSG